MADGRRFVSMRVKFVAVLAVAFVTVALGALALIPVALNIFRGAYMQPEQVSRRLDGYIRSFAEYVAKEEIRSDDAMGVVKWTRRHRSVYLSVLSESDPNFGAAGGELWEGDAKPGMEPFFNELIPDNSGSYGGSQVNLDEYGTVYAVRFANGLSSVAVVDYSVSTWSDGIVIAGVCLAGVVFLFFVLGYYHSQTRAIVALSEDVEMVSSGILDGMIVADRNDEIGRLAADVDHMRNTILRRMEEREEAWQANADLLTSMTHDIRTPLTTLLGYMELLNGESEDMTEEQKNYLRLCTAKAEQIKGLSDKLFLYFWAYNRRDTDQDGDVLEAALLFEQLIGDYIPGMEAVGPVIKTDFSALAPDVMISVHMDSLRRIADNLFDNAQKYASTSEPLCILAEKTGDTVVIAFRNRIGVRREHTTSTHIGLRTCHNMMAGMGGRFEVEHDEEYYTARLIFPVR